jgi:uncharacterized protein (TIGR03083 family)
MMSLVTATGPADTAVARDPQRPARLLRAEHDTLLPILRRAAWPAFDRPTPCPGWSVRDVLAHCGAALSRVSTGRLRAFTPELNEIDVAERRGRPLPEILSELATGYLAAGPVIAGAGGRLDAIALGEWLHGGDVRPPSASRWPTRATASPTRASCSPTGPAAGPSRWSRSACPAPPCGSAPPCPAGRRPPCAPAPPP